MKKAPTRRPGTKPRLKGFFPVREMEIEIQFFPNTGKFFANCPIGSLEELPHPRSPSLKDSAWDAAIQLAYILGLKGLTEPMPIGVNAWKSTVEISY